MAARGLGFLSSSPSQVPAHRHSPEHLLPDLLERKIEGAWRQGDGDRSGGGGGEGRKGGRGEGRSEEIERKDWNGESKIKRPKEETKSRAMEKEKTQKSGLKSVKRRRESQGNKSAGEGTADKDAPKEQGRQTAGTWSPRGPGRPAQQPPGRQATDYCASI